MTALLKFVITSILSLLGFTGPVENGISKINYAPNDQELPELVDIKSIKNCDENLINSCFLLK